MALLVTMNDSMSSSADDFIDVIQGNRVYLKCLYVGDINLLCYPNKPLLGGERCTVQFSFSQYMFVCQYVASSCSPWFSGEWHCICSASQCVENGAFFSELRERGGGRRRVRGVRERERKG